MTNVRTKYHVTSTKEYVHRQIAEKALGRKLKSTEIVHHVDYDKSNNTPENLVICPDQAYHKLLHARQDIANDGYSPDLHHYCSHHKRYEFKEAFSFRKAWCGLHNMCREATRELKKLSGYRTIFDWRARLNQQYRRILKEVNNKVCPL